MTLARGRGWREVGASYLYNGIFCLAIAALLQALGTGGTWLQSLAVSFSIGYSINTSFIVLGDPLARLIGHRLAAVLISALGLTLGVALGGWLAVGDPWVFFGGNYGTIVLGVFFGVLGFIFFAQRADLLNTRAQLAEAEAEMHKQQRQQTETELRLLQAQIEPHFLFNTLSNVASLIRTQPDVAERTLEHLTQFLRASLRRTRRTSIRLQEELDVLNAYLEIQSVRMAGRMKFTIDCDPSLHDLSFPPLLIQPLVENAVIHGIEPSTAGGHISVNVRRRDQAIIVEVADSGVGIHEQSGGHNMGLTNTRERAAALFGPSASLALTENEPSGVIATLTLPETA